MKKLLVFLVMFGVLMLGIGSVMAEVLVGGANVTVGPGTVEVVISPLTITFGNLHPGTVNSTATSGNVVISASTTDASDADIQIEVEVTDGTDLFVNNLFFDDVLADDYAVELPCVGTEICTYVNVPIVPTLTVPFGTPLGFDSAVITYTITGAQPAD
jgi:hypothetical protein